MIYLRTVTLGRPLFSQSKDVSDFFTPRETRHFYIKLLKALYFPFDTNGIFIYRTNEYKIPISLHLARPVEEDAIPRIHFPYLETKTEN